MKSKSGSQPTSASVAWSLIQCVMRESSGVNIYDSDIDKSKRDTLTTAVFIEIGKGEYAGEWLFPHIEHAMACLSNRNLIRALYVFKDIDYLVSIHDATGH